MTVVADLVARLRMESSGFNSESGRARRELEELRSAGEKAHHSLRRIFEVGVGIAGFQAVHNLTGTLVGFARESINVAARVEEMDVVLTQLARTSGVAKEKMDAATKSIKDNGITTAVAQDTVAQFTRYNIDLAKSQELATVAQDAAIFANENSSATLQRLIYGIQTHQTEVLRTAGINVDIAQSYEKLATEIGKNAEQLTEAEKQQAILNGILQEGTKITGTYDAAMQSAGKQLRSFPRYLEEIQEAFGSAFLPVFDEAVFKIAEFLKATKGSLESGGLKDFVEGFGKGLLNFIQDVGPDIVDFLKAVGDLAVTAGPALKDLAMIFGGTLLTGFKALLDVMTPVAQFLADHPELVRAVIFAYAAFKTIDFVSDVVGAISDSLSMANNVMEQTPGKAAGAIAAIRALRTEQTASNVSGMADPLGANFFNSQGFPNKTAAAGKVAAGGIGATAAALGVAVAPTLALTGAFLLLNHQLTAMAKNAADTKSKVEGWVGILQKGKSEGEAAALAAFAQSKSVDELGDSYKSVGVGLDAVFRGVTGGKQAFNSLVQSVLAANPEIGKVRGGVELLEKALRGSNSAAKTLDSSLSRNGDMSRSARHDLFKFVETVGDMEQHSNRAAEQMKDLADAQNSAAGAARYHTEEAAALGRALEEVGGRVATARQGFAAGLGTQGLLAGFGGPSERGKPKSGGGGGSDNAKALADANKELARALEQVNYAQGNANPLYLETKHLLEDLGPKHRELARGYEIQVQSIIPLQNRLKELQTRYNEVSREIDRLQEIMSRPLQGDSEFRRQEKDLEQHIRMLTTQRDKAVIAGTDPLQIQVITRNIEELNLALEILRNKRADEIQPVLDAIEAANKQPEVSFGEAISAAGQLGTLGKEAKALGTEMTDLQRIIERQNEVLGPLGSALQRVVSAQDALTNALKSTSGAGKEAEETLDQFMNRTIDNARRFAEAGPKLIEKFTMGITDPKQRTMIIQSINELIEQGPQRAGKIIDAMLDTTSEKSIKNYQNFISTSGSLAESFGEGLGSIMKRQIVAQAVMVEKMKQESKAGAEASINSIAEVLDLKKSDIIQAYKDLGFQSGMGFKNELERIAAEFDISPSLAKAGVAARDTISKVLRGVADGGIINFAKGGIQHFAGGGENHLAEIASPGMIRVWNEPETGGEGYIPLALSKRDRSTKILSEIATRFGMELLPAGMSQESTSSIGAGTTISRSVSTSGGGSSVTVDLDVHGSVVTHYELGEMIRSIILDIQSHNVSSGIV